VLKPDCPKCGRSHVPGPENCADNAATLEGTPPQPRRCNICGAVYPEGVVFCFLDGGSVGIEPPDVVQPSPPKVIAEMPPADNGFKIFRTIGEAKPFLHRHYLSLVGALAVVAAVQLVLSLIPYVNLFSGLLVVAPLYGGCITVFLIASSGREPTIGNLFSQFSRKYFPFIGTTLLKLIVLLVPCGTATLTGVGAIYKAAASSYGALAWDIRHGINHAAQYVTGVEFHDIPGMQTFLDSGWEWVIMWLGLSLLVSAILLVLLAFAEIIVVDRTNNPFRALLGSSRLARRHLFKYSLLFVILFLYNLLGLIPLGLGLLYTIPLSWAVLVTVYVKAVGVKTVYE